MSSIDGEDLHSLGFGLQPPGSHDGIHELRVDLIEDFKMLKEADGADTEKLFPLLREPRKMFLNLEQCH